MTICLLLIGVLTVLTAAAWSNVLRVGATRQGKTLAAARTIVESRGVATVCFDPHKQSLAEQVLTHARGNVLFERLSDVRRSLGFDLLLPSLNPDPELARIENLRRAGFFVDILVRRRNADGLAGSPLVEEWTYAALGLFLCQSSRKPVAWLPFALMPGTDEFRTMVRDCTDPELRYKFGHLASLSPRGLRAEVGSAGRLVNGVFRSPSFVVRARGGFDLGAFLQQRGLLVVEKGDDLDDDTMRVVMGAIVQLVVDHAKRRPNPVPPIRIVIDEATNARLVGAPELRGIAETNKNGLYWEFLVQNLDFPGGADGVLQNCLRHEWFGCPHYDLARKAASDVVAGLPRDERSRAERVADLTDEIMGLEPGWRYVRDRRGSHKEYVPLLVSKWPAWPGLRQAELEEQLRWIYSRPEYRTDSNVDANSDDSSSCSRPPPSRSPRGSSPAERWKRAESGPTPGSTGNGSGDGSASSE